MQRRLGIFQFTGLVGSGLLMFCAAIFVSGQHIRAREASPVSVLADAAMEPSADDAAAMAEAAGIVSDDAPPADDGGAVAILNPVETSSPATADPLSMKTEWSERLLYRPVPSAAGRLEAQGYRIEIEGVKPLDPDEKCTGTDGQAWFCGAAARTQFRNYLRGRALTCAVPDEAPNEPVVTRCSVGGEDIGRWLAVQGWAQAEVGGALAQPGEEARQARRGIYGNKPVLPAILIEQNSDAAPPASLAVPALDALAPPPTTQRPGNFPPPPALPVN